MTHKSDGDPAPSIETADKKNERALHAGEAIVHSAVVDSEHEIMPAVASPNEQIAQRVCRALLQEMPGYQGVFSFGTPGGNDLDLRLCFADLNGVDQGYVHSQIVGQLQEQGVDVEVDLLFMSGGEFVSGIRDLVELGDVTERLRNGFDPHEQQAAVGDTSMFSLYIFSTMRTLHRNRNAAPFGSPDQALDHLMLTRDGAVGWMHFYTGSFLHEYLNNLSNQHESMQYQDRVAKFVSRVICGNTLARIRPESKLTGTFKAQLITAIKNSDARHSTDARMTEVLLQNPDSRVLLDMQSQAILDTASKIRNGDTSDIQAGFVPAAEAELFYRSFEAGIDRRSEIGETVDPLTSYALGDLLRGMGRRISYAPGKILMRQGEPGTEIMYLPLKTQDGQDNAPVEISVARPEGPNILYTRGPGRTVGEGGLFGLTRSATVTTQGRVEAYTIASDTVRALLADSELRDQLQRPLLETREARRLDVLLRYFAREAAIFTRQSLSYTRLESREATQDRLGENPLAAYNMGLHFKDVLRHLAASGAYPDIRSLTADKQVPRTLFTVGQQNDRLYIVASGEVNISLHNDEILTLKSGEYFGESCLLSMPTTGSAILTPASTALTVDAQWFKRFTQSRQPIQDIKLPKNLRNILPVHLLYHLAAEGYNRVRRRLATQSKLGQLQN